MATATNPPEQCIVLEHVPWEVYEGLLAAHRDRSVPRFTYDQGRLEIMSPSPAHERLKHVVGLFVEVVAEELGLSIAGFGSTTFRRQDVQRGFEPDACFYIQHAAQVRGQGALDLTMDPPPDLVIAIDLTSSSLGKFPLFAQMGVPELWRYDGHLWHIGHLHGTDYTAQTMSLALPVVTAEALAALLDDSRTRERLLWLRQVRAWVRAPQPGAGAL